MLMETPGLDTSVILAWLIEQGYTVVVCLTQSISTTRADREQAFLADVVRTIPQPSLLDLEDQMHLRSTSYCTRILPLHGNGEETKS